ncbi:Uncharacterised protein [Avibacterium paragallinarum]|uniref:Uncharacterized protein n=1 Tax=Avibacterium paragallinarum TaxID=728 RepID=A0A377IA31_AVIPA|nr:Uncharacterised protein [Avibacterium paragallinarum]
MSIRCNAMINPLILKARFAERVVLPANQRFVLF